MKHSPSKVITVVGLDRTGSNKMLVVMTLVDLERQDGSGQSDVSDSSGLLVVPDWRWLAPRMLCSNVIGLNSLLDQDRASRVSKMSRADVRASLVLKCVKRGFGKTCKIKVVCWIESTGEMEVVKV